MPLCAFLGTLVQDSIHPSGAGHQLIADWLLSHLAAAQARGAAAGPPHAWGARIFTESRDRRRRWRARTALRAGGRTSTPGAGPSAR